MITHKLLYANVCKVLLIAYPSCSVQFIPDVYLEANLFPAFILKPVDSVQHVSQINILYWTKIEQTGYCITGTNYITLSWET